jgi:hypothetical protein
MRMRTRSCVKNALRRSQQAVSKSITSHGYTVLGYINEIDVASVNPTLPKIGRPPPQRIDAS